MGLFKGNASKMGAVETNKSCYHISPELLERFRKHAYEHFGIHFQPNKLEVLAIKLGKIANRFNTDLKIFYKELVGGSLQAKTIFLNELTVGHTYFFREEEHFDVLIRDSAQYRQQKIHIWCAASSTGEEPYSIAISLLEAGRKNFKILASDISKKALDCMHRGIYAFKPHKEMDKRIVRKYFSKVDKNRYQISPELRRHLVIKHINLNRDIEFETAVDYVFCRNVMIYFDEKTRQRVLERLVQNLKPQGLLFVGHSEAILNTPAGLKKEGQATYRKVM